MICVSSTCPWPVKLTLTLFLLQPDLYVDAQITASERLMQVNDKYSLGTLNSCAAHISYPRLSTMTVLSFCAPRLYPLHAPIDHVPICAVMGSA